MSNFSRPRTIMFSPTLSLWLVAIGQIQELINMSWDSKPVCACKIFYMYFTNSAGDSFKPASPNEQSKAEGFIFGRYSTHKIYDWHVTSHINDATVRIAARSMRDGGGENRFNSLRSLVGRRTAFMTLMPHVTCAHKPIGHGHG
jgi:hypothetical protein